MTSTGLQISPEDVWRWIPVEEERNEEVGLERCCKDCKNNKTNTGQIMVMDLFRFVPSLSFTTTHAVNP
jgi:hypothetical protein